MSTKNIRNAKNQSEKPGLLKASQRWLIVTGKDQYRLMTDEDQIVSGLTYVKLPRDPQSKGTFEEVTDAKCAATEKVFSLIAMPQKQGEGDDAKWEVVARVHPVIMRRQMIAAERRALSLETIASKHGEKLAALLGKK